MHHEPTGESIRGQWILRVPRRRSRPTRQNLIYSSQNGVESGLDGITAIDRDIAMQNLLKDFRIRRISRTRSLSRFSRSRWASTLCGCKAPDEIHRNVRVDKKYASTVGYAVAALNLRKHVVYIRRGEDVGRPPVRIGFSPRLPTVLRRRAAASACRTHAAIDNRCASAARCISRYSGS